MCAAENKPANRWFHIPIQSVGVFFCVYFYFHVPKSGKALLLLGGIAAVMMLMDMRPLHKGIYISIILGLVLIENHALDKERATALTVKAVQSHGGIAQHDLGVDRISGLPDKVGGLDDLNGMVSFCFLDDETARDHVDSGFYHLFRPDLMILLGSTLAVSHPLFRSLTCASKLGRVKPENCFAVLVRSLRLAPKAAFFLDVRPTFEVR